MTTRTRTRTPRRIKSWADVEHRNEALGANGKELSNLLVDYYTARGQTSAPGATVMRIIGSVTVKSNVASGQVDVHFGIKVVDKDFSSASIPVPYLEQSSWLWTERIIDTNLMSFDGTNGAVNRHRIALDVGSRRRLHAADDRLMFYIFNSDATNAIAYSYDLRILLALP